MHGPSAFHGLLEIPEMPLGNGINYHPGLGFTGPDHFDANGLPRDREIGVPSNTSARIRNDLLWAEWVDTYQHGGGPMLIALEGQRQRQRMDSTGVAHAFKPTDVCGGGKRLSECETAESMTREAREIAASTCQPSVSNEGPIWNVPLQLSRICGSCALNCQVAYETNDGMPTGITRFTTTQPLSDVEVIHIDVATLGPAVRATDEAASLGEVFERLEGLTEGDDQE